MNKVKLLYLIIEVSSLAGVFFLAFAELDWGWFQPAYICLLSLLAVVFEHERTNEEWLEYEDEQ